MLLTFQIIISIAVLLLALPLGYLLAWLTREELVQGRLAFALIMAVSIAGIIAVLFFSLEISLKLSLVFALLFIFTASAVSMFKSYNKKFVKV